MAYTIRAYERADAPLSERLPSLIRRFPCLKGAKGIDPWDAEAFYSWVAVQGANSPAFHAGHLALNLQGAGPWQPFDAIAAAQAWGEKDREVFVNWMRVWRFKG
jgi:hypothetical protein